MIRRSTGTLCTTHQWEQDDVFPPSLHDPILRTHFDQTDVML